MIIWNQKLIKKLCRTHLCVMWRDGLWVYRVVCEQKKFYTYHPVVREFWNDPMKLWQVLFAVRLEMLKRGCRPMDMPPLKASPKKRNTSQYLTLDQQVEVLRARECNCLL